MNASGLRVVEFLNNKFYVAYRRNYTPFTYLKNSSDRDKIIIYQTTATRAQSLQLKNLSIGQSYTADGVVVKYELNKDSDTPIVSFNLVDGNAKPVANNQSVAVVSNPKTITLTATDSDNDTLSYSIFKNPSNGILTGTGDTWIYTTNANYVGADSFIYEVSDGKISSFATVTISVTQPTPPVANDMTITTIRNTAQDITLDASDINGDTLSYTINQPSNGTVTGSGPTITYTPNSNSTGPDTFTFKANEFA